MDNHDSKVEDHGGTFITCCLDHLHHYADGPAALSDYIFEITFFTMSIMFGIGGPSSAGSLDGYHSSSTLRSFS